MEKKILTGAMARIILRYAAGALAMHGYLSATDSASIAGDADLQLIVATALVAGVELYYRLAKRYGWPT